MTTKSALEILNQSFEMEKKIKDSTLEKSLQRNINRIKSTLEATGYRCHNPLGEKYSLTRLDVEAMVSGESADNLYIVEVIKPIIYFNGENGNVIAQKGVVITESR